MGKFFFKLVGIVTAVSMLSMCFGTVGIQVSGNGHTAHVIETGESFEGNPLKGMVPFDYSTTDFPHSMEWFYLPVSAVQTGMNEFDWSQLEARLNTIAGRGHQAVFRFYYDYPGEKVGVPQFLIDGGLEMRYYNEPENLGGSGYCPNYENLTFRQSMKNFISAFGKRYDGDKRIGYITLGLLGFWGEWHNWPYDEDTSDGRQDWSISTEVFKEVLDAFDTAFNKTQLCVREPKKGIDYSNYDIGFHDDSFGYSTLSVSKGGMEWDFMQKLFDFNQQYRWKTNCIGGEIYPPIQGDLFNANKTNSDCQSWDACMEESHATWMLCDNIKYYTGSILTNAIEASKQLGYDFQVSTAYYDDTNISSPLYLKVDIKNIGAAPFYYNHTLWPVEIGVKQGDNIVKTWRTEWDLCDIPADNTDYSFEYTVDNHNLDPGSYSICIKVVNPLENGNILGFANKNQGNDGWLNLGNINILNTTGASEETTAEIVSEEITKEIIQEETTNTSKAVKLAVTSDTDNIYFNIKSNMEYKNWQVYVDADNSKSTGYLDGTLPESGLDYMIENGFLYEHRSNDNTWNWSAVSGAVIDVSNTDEGLSVKASKDSFVLPDTGAKVWLKLLDDSWNTIGMSEIATIVEQEMEQVIITDDLEINGYQISASAEGMRTVYSVDTKVEGQNVTEIGLIYGIDSMGYRQNDMVANSDNSSVYTAKGTVEKGKLSYVFSKFESYAMTMKFASKTAEEYKRIYYVRAYAKLADGTYAYTNIEQYAIYDIADYMYQNNKMSNYYSHNYLYDSILKIANKDYQMKEYNWNNILVLPK